MRPGNCSALIAIATIAAQMAVAGAPASAQDARLVVELNKFEDVESGCRSFFLFRNQTETVFAAFEMSLAILDKGGVIDRLLTIDAAPLPAERTTLKLFEIPEIGCADIGEVLLHDITACAPQNEAELDCFPLIDLSSKTSAPLVK
ncbi:hypothetical protein [Paralimibaculum aggregatum]|uniref:hypothetical protein n=1 Tax=Paralimibaculum aggregatum TaxID=3036245 RepID=UPI0025579BC5|nr:hypothetical protein [Limibaculum sp. NKW23]